MDTMAVTQMNKHKDKQRHRMTFTEKDTQTNQMKIGRKDRCTHTQTDRHTDRQTDRQTDLFDSCALGA